LQHAVSSRRDAAAATTGTQRLSPRALVAYGAFGMPLAMAALPLYVHLPRFYGDTLGVGLAALGGLLLVLRLLDGLLDPLLGAWSDRAASRRGLIALAAPVLAVGMVALFAPPVSGEGALLGWLAASLFAVYLAFSLATINHGAWGAEMSGDPVERTRITAVREALALVGVVAASVAPSLLGGGGGDDAGLPKFTLVFAAVTAVCLALLWTAPAGVRRRAEPAHRPARLFAGLGEVMRNGEFRALLLVFMLNGIASAIPATLVLFFIADVLGATDRQGLFLALYFVAGAAGMPLWVALSKRLGKARTWGLAMVAAIAAFVWAAFLGPGDVVPFAVVCVVSGMALGADLALPPSLLADVIDRHGDMDDAGAYFGVWTLATKLNLAIAAGLALPLLAWLGYAPGAREAPALVALAVVYAAVPCVFKLGAVVALRTFAGQAKEVR
jgi:Na+/melibiose symporter-like transporter